MGNVYECIAIGSTLGFLGAAGMGEMVELEIEEHLWASALGAAYGGMIVGGTVRYSA